MPTLPRRSFITLVVIPFGFDATRAEAEGALEPERHLLDDAERFPNSVLPALVYRGALSGNQLADEFERRFAEHHWTGAWRNGLYTRHHYHSTAHEALGVSQGWVNVRLGGPSGPLVELRAGDAAVLPAGVAHKNEQQSADFRVVGAYPRGTSANLCFGAAGERPRADDEISAVPMPETDPLSGARGALLRSWKRP